MSREELLIAVLDRLLPATGALAGAGELGLAPKLSGDPLLDAAPDVIERVLEALGEGFLELDDAAKDEALRRVERDEADAFSILISVVYNAYYIDERVLRRIEGLTAYKAGAPQPGGYDIEPFDESLLARTSRREPFWRKVGS